MITYKKGDLITAFKNREVQVIAHQANCFCNMKSGIAKQLVKEFPEVKEVDDNTEYGDKDKMGGVTVAYTEHGPIFNIYGQFGWNRHYIQTDYEALRRGLLNMREFLLCGCEDYIIGLPKIGAGLGGGDWSTIEKIIEEVFEEHEVVIYELKAEVF